jgi:hypothetical protein
MRMATGARRLAMPAVEPTKRRWHLGAFIALSCAVVFALAAVAQQLPTKVSIRPTGPMPGVGVP